MPFEVKLKNVRLGPFPALFVPQAFKGEGDPAYSAKFLITPGSENEALVQQAIMKAAEEKWGQKAAALVQSLIARDLVCLHDGVHQATKYEGFTGMKYVSARNAKFQDGTYTVPGIFDNVIDPATKQVRRVPADEAGRVYGGCYVNALVTIAAQDNNFGQRVNARVLGVQFHGDGDAFGARTANAGDFDAVDVPVGAPNPWGSPQPVAASPLA